MVSADPKKAITLPHSCAGWTLMDAGHSVQALLAEKEGPWLDRKACHHDDVIDLLHDLLCLANSWAETDRYLIFGIADDGKVVGVERDRNRRLEAGIQDLLRQSNLNRIPEVEMRTHKVRRHQVDVLLIRNRPDKPFFLTKDKTLGRKTIRAGVVYTRLGDTNTPLTESAREDAIELMWRERFGLGLSPLHRAFRLLNDREKWKWVGENYMYHEEFPEFTVGHGRRLNDDFKEPWSTRFPDPSARSYEVDLKYGTTILRRYIFVSCDGGRYRVPIPDRSGDQRFCWNMNSIPWRIAILFERRHSLEDALKWSRVELFDGPSDE